MIVNYANKQYASAHSRMFAAAFDRFLKVNVPQCGGPEIRSLLVDKIIELFETYTTSLDHLKPGQMMWVAVDKNTRPDSCNVKYNPVVLTLVSPDEIQSLQDGECHPPKLLPNTVARLFKEAYSQRSLLSNRDLGLIFKRHPTNLADIRQQYEKENNCVLPTPSTIQDMGSGITHKTKILYKILIEKKDMVKVREETAHTQQAIDRYLKDYRRVELLLDDKKSIMFIAQVTRMSPFLIMQYELIYIEYKSNTP